MKIYNTVKTDKEAKALLKEWRNVYGNKYMQIKRRSFQCECGETSGFECCGITTNLCAGVAVCGACGDDDAFTSDVLNVI